MNGLELSRAFFEECGRPMLEAHFSDVLPFLAAGVFGSGSECFGFDDEISRDHDFEPGFCLFLPEEAVVDRRTAFLLERAYTGLPKTFGGVSRPVLKPVGGARRGIFRTEDFFRRTAGTPNGVLGLQAWLTVPEQALAEATNGEVYFDNFGEVTRIREVLSYFPEDVRLKRLAGHLLLMAQAGQYNYARCLAHGEQAAAQLAVVEFVGSAVSAAFLLSRRYQPYYKWRFRALRTLPAFGHLAQPLERLLTTGNDPDTAKEKTCLIEQISADILSAVRAQSLSDAVGDDLERHAYAVNNRVQDPALRNLHILAAV